MKRLKKDPNATVTLFVRTKLTLNYNETLVDSIPAIPITSKDLNLERTTIRNNSSNKYTMDIIEQSHDIECVVIKCNKCMLEFSNQELYYSHLSDNHPELLTVSCKICTEKFLNRKQLQKHKSVHAGPQPYLCTKCTERFSNLEALTAHLRRHEGKLPYVCSVCEEEFETKADQIKHQETEHKKVSKDADDKPPLKCPECPRAFKKACDIQRHRRVHTGEKPYVCKVCGRGFQQAHNLTKHLIIHTDIKMYTCDVCSENFGRKDVLNRHMLTHVVEKPFACKVCDKYFARQNQLVVHNKMKHLSDDQSKDSAKKGKRKTEPKEKIGRGKRLRKNEDSADEQEEIDEPEEIEVPEKVQDEKIKLEKEN